MVGSVRVGVVVVGVRLVIIRHISDHFMVRVVVMKVWVVEKLEEWIESANEIKYHHNVSVLFK